MAYVVKFICDGKIVLKSEVCGSLHEAQSFAAGRSSGVKADAIIVVKLNADGDEISTEELTKF
ncbi:MAG: hypothetical protein J0H34_03670 [Rhizobiales bacterium]|nr:hypothetical protein [Hyphomicrobiales bacterium]MBN9547065.1 hypothetical protein [Alphaproteobacteria bacterium]